MSARVLIVDDFAPNRALLEAHLTSEYFEVLTASNGVEAMAIVQRGDCDIVLLDVMMPGLDGFEVCRRLKRDPATHHIPIVLVTALDQPADRVRGLEAGAEDFLTKPIDEIALIARVRSLSRLKVVLDELRSRAATSATLGMPDPASAAIRDDVSGARILVIEDKPVAARQIAGTLAGAHLVDVECDPHEALFRGAEGTYDLFVVSLGLQSHDGLRLCSQFRSLERTRQVPILIVAEAEDRKRLLRGLDLGINDYVLRPIDANELIARARTQLRRKFYADSLRDNVQASIEMAIVDTLTGLNNRRFFNTNFAALMDQAARRGRPLSLMILDIDHFKRVNDTLGHDAGDQILKTFSARVRNVVRTSDLICRLGGEEFTVLMPDTTLGVAAKVAERVRQTIESHLFVPLPGRPPIPVTVSIGLAERGIDLDPDVLMRRADAALYRSKGEGRNRVTADAA
jgi:two-component system, cell cycle response regulator